MAFSALDRKRIEAETERFVESKRPPANIRGQVDLGFRLENQSVAIFETRPRWDSPKEKMESPVAKATYSKVKQVWKVYWMRADLKWHGYVPHPEVEQLSDFLMLIDEDKHACFWG
jgi:hypothetical protein